LKKSLGNIIVEKNHSRAQKHISASHHPRYLAVHPESIICINLKACAHYQLYNGKAAEAELKVLQQAGNPNVRMIFILILNTLLLPNPLLLRSQNVIVIPSDLPRDYCYDWRRKTNKPRQLQKQTPTEPTQIFQEHDLLKHNICVFRGGENALSVLPPLIDVIPEARLNLVIYLLKHTNDWEEAYSTLTNTRDEPKF
jgi:hypothetical protein